METISKASDVLACQDCCQEKPNCKIFYWHRESSICKIAEHLYKDENKIIEDINSIIGHPNCSHFNPDWQHSIFITKVQKSTIGLITGCIFAVLLIGLIALALVRMLGPSEYFSKRRKRETAFRIPPMLELQAHLEGPTEGLMTGENECPNIHIIRLNFILNFISNIVLSYCNIV
jgi:hypothetical protein